MSSNPDGFLKAAGYVPKSPASSSTTLPPLQNPERAPPESSSKKSTACPPQKGVKIEEPSAEPREEKTSDGDHHRPKKKGRVNDALPDSSDQDLKGIEAWFREVSGIPLDGLHYQFSILCEIYMERKKVEKLEAEAKEASKLIETYRKEIVEACADRDKANDQFKRKHEKLVEVMHKSYSKTKKLKKLEEDLAAARIDAYERGRAAGEASLEPLKKKQRLEVVQDFIKSPVFERLCDRRVGTQVINAFFKSVKQCQKLKDLPTDFDFTKLNVALNENLEPYPDEDGDEYEVDLSTHEFGSLLDTSDPKL
ncbi:hypothetical protein ACJIZ3_014947 [Penstemon smallii]|uniref:Uncharacterized protein n=1 Tax=Penstemon smallii TaxID=265156 RepID=A0ABD3RL65_9LAMI